MEHNDGGPAFPWGEHGQILGGMSLRDYFAAKAMPTFIDLCAPEIWNQANAYGAKIDNTLMAVKAAYCVADAMLKVRGTQP